MFTIIKNENLSKATKKRVLYKPVKNCIILLTLLHSKPFVFVWMSLQVQTLDSSEYNFFTGLQKLL